jgi:glucose-6-phosphate 1-dehydrogenase
MEQAHVVVLSGATGDLARRTPLPGLLRLWKAGLLEQARIIGTSLEDLDDEQFEKLAATAGQEFGRGAFTEDDWARFAAGLS